MALLLQPVFMDLTPTTIEEDVEKRCQDTPRQSDGNEDKRNGVELSSDNLHSMWKVATKVKGVMPEGARFENLTWRAWYRRTLLDRQNSSTPTTPLLHDTERYSNGDSPSGSLKTESTSLPNATHQLASSSQSLESPSSSLPRLNNNKAYSVILAEIQQAAQKVSSFSPGVKVNNDHFKAASLPSQPFYPSLIPSTRSNARSPYCRCDQTGCSQSHPTSDSSVSTNNISTTTSSGHASSSRKKKKNVEKFLRRQVQQELSQLEIIEEQREESKTPSLTDITIERRVVPHSDDLQMPLTKTIPMDYSSVSTNDTLSGSDGERAGSSSASRRNRESTQRPTSGMFRMQFMSSASPSSDSSQQTTQKAIQSDRPNVSLLTMLLNRQPDPRRPDSCPPPFTEISPPMRPGAPLPLSRQQITQPMAEYATSPPVSALDLAGHSSRRLDTTRASQESLTTPPGRQPPTDSGISPNSRSDRKRTGLSANDFMPRMTIW